MVSFQVNDTAMAESSLPQRNSGMRIGLLGAGGLARESGIPFVLGREALCSVGGHWGLDRLPGAKVLFHGPFGRAGERFGPRESKNRLARVL